MTDLRIAEAIATSIALLDTQVSFLFDLTMGIHILLFGYLLAAYFIGKNLTRIQAGIFTGLYLVALVPYLIGYVRGYLSAIGKQTQILRLAPDFPVIYTVNELMIFVVIHIAMILASIYFMWLIKHPKT